MTNRLMETACARLCLLTPIAWDESMPPLFSRMAVRRMMECGALSGLVLRRTDMLPQATFDARKCFSPERVTGFCVWKPMKSWDIG